MMNGKEDAMPTIENVREWARRRHNMIAERGATTSEEVAYIEGQLMELEALIDWLDEEEQTDAHAQKAVRILNGP
jgi:hypothetical protein